MPESRGTPRRPKPPRRFRRSPHLVAFWRRGALHLTNYATGRTIRANPLVVAALEVCASGTTAAELATVLGIPPASAVRLLQRLAGFSMVGDVAADPDPREVAMAAFDSWNPAAGFFHTATRDVRFLSQRAANQFARERTRESPPPPSVTRHRQAPVVALPRPATDAFAEVLTARRTWRRFGSGAVDIGELATVLALSLGVQRWVRVGGRDVPLKTSPSGGARHPLEGYLVIRRVTGVEPGIYHYASDRHLLERLGGPVPLARIRTWFPHGGYFAQAPVLVFLAAVFARQLWRYPYARAYRAALVEAGHVAQTWCLASTALNLAPFCLMGLADSAIEADLGLDAVATPVLYAAGLGRRPGRSDWAPLPRGTLASRANPRL